jgi:hypothetical protein
LPYCWQYGNYFEGCFIITVILIAGMAKNSGPPLPVPTAKRPRGRPPKPGGRAPQVEVQRAYRARLAAAGKAVRVVDTAHASPPLASPKLAAIPDFDPATQLVCDREMFEDMRERLRNALLKMELREQDVARLETRNAYLEGELKLQERHHTNTLKEVITLRQQLAKRR